MKEIGVYIHIPFCKSKCYYCDFNSFSNKENSINDYIECLKKEIINKSSFEYLIKTIYIGGGTPSYIDCKYIEEILGILRNHYNISEDVEITIEVNPGTANKDKLEKYYAIGINRLSIGLQTSNNQILKSIGRIHSFEQYKQTIDLAKQAGFSNINSDIIIGLPSQTIYDIEDTINSLIDMGLQHISVYSLIIEEGTVLENKIKNKELKLPDEEIERYMYWFAKRKLEKNGFKHYEISNFAKPGFVSKHNLDCWNQKEYIGFGVSASSYENKTRFSNIGNLDEYIKNINTNSFEKNYIIEEKQTLEAEQNEFMILGLRKISGIRINDFRKKFGRSPLIVYEKQIKELIAQELIALDVDSIKLTKKGLDFANLVWEEFI
ncbi:MAG: oxygen-independent coproporphyrinogen III oxidase [Clostridia bacterium]|nr:oxygen-independent coproporphyrinogen III oxidase [Clostridia bacterium]